MKKRFNFTSLGRLKEESVEKYVVIDQYGIDDLSFTHEKDAKKRADELRDMYGGGFVDVEKRKVKP